MSIVFQPDVALNQIREVFLARITLGSMERARYHLIQTSAAQLQMSQQQTGGSAVNRVHWHQCTTLITSPMTVLLVLITDTKSD